MREVLLIIHVPQISLHHHHYTTARTGSGGGSNKPLYASSVRTGRHTEPVWAVKWQPLDGGGGGGGGAAASLVGRSVRA